MSSAQHQQGDNETVNAQTSATAIIVSCIFAIVVLACIYAAVAGLPFALLGRPYNGYRSGPQGIGSAVGSLVDSIVAHSRSAGGGRSGGRRW